MDSRERARVRKEAQALDAAVQVGREGVTPGVIAELVRQLEATRIVKVRLLRGASGEGDTKRVAERLAEAAHAELVEVRGHTAVFARRRR